MELIVLGSNSFGNCYILNTKNAALVIEAGISFNEVKKALDFDTLKIVGLLCTHSHGDHAKYIGQYMKEGISVYSSQDTFDSLGYSKWHFAKQVKPLEIFGCGEFLIQPFEVKHDVTCYGYQITHPDCGNVIFMTDTKHCVYTFKNINNWLIECNHSREILTNRVDSGQLEQVQANRVMENHLSLEELKLIKKS